jgi:hypothetical protein
VKGVIMIIKDETNSTKWIWHHRKEGSNILVKKEEAFIYVWSDGT